MEAKLGFREARDELEPEEVPAQPQEQQHDGDLSAKVESYVQKLESQLREYMAKEGLAEQTLKSQEYKKITEALQQLEQAVDQQSSVDEQEFRKFWQEMRQAALGGQSWMSMNQVFEAEMTTLRQRLQELLKELHTKVQEEVLVHIEVPENLEVVADQWDEVAKVSAEARQLLQKTQKVDGWHGQAATQYQQTAQAQIQENSEFGRLAESLARAHRSLGTLNSATLSAVYEVLRGAQLEIQTPQAEVLGRFFPRMTTTVERLQHLLAVSLPEAITVCDDQVRETTREVATEVETACGLSSGAVVGGGAGASFPVEDLAPGYTTQPVEYRQ